MRYASGILKLILSADAYEAFKKYYIEGRLFTGGVKYIFNSIRYMPYRLCDIHIHPSTYLSSKSVLKRVPFNKGSIRIGKNSFIMDFAMVLTYRGKIEIGDHCSINPFTIAYGHGGLKIGNFVRIAAHCTLIPSNHKFEDPNIPIYMQGHDQKGITIEDDVWIGANCTILDGVTIGTGSVIAAGAVVNKSIPSYSIAGGVPVRILGTRKNEVI